MEDKTQEEILNLTRENNKILRSMRGSQRRTSFFQAIYWLFIIGSAMSAYYYLQPMFDSAMKGYQDTVSKINDASDALPLKMDTETVQKMQKALGI
ncbi:MAG: hypothetical protein WCO84_00165 [bacterium]